MKLWIIKQNKNNGYDTYDSAVVAAETEEEARLTHPSPFQPMWDGTESPYGSWCNIKYVTVEFLGETDRKIRGVVVASFNAG